MGTVVRGLIDREKVHKLMGLREKQKVMLAQSIGHPLKKVPLNLSKISDGTYYGVSNVVIPEAEEKNAEYKVKVIVKDHQIIDIEIIQIGDSEYENQSRVIVDNVVKKQSLDVDAVSGATLSCKALLEAIEKALK